MPRVAPAQEDAAQNAILATSTNYWVSLHTADPGTTGASEGSDGRQSVQFNASSSGSQTNSTSATWPSAVGGATYSFWGLWTLSSGGSFLRGGTMNVNITPPAGGQINVASGAITCTAS